MNACLCFYNVCVGEEKLIEMKDVLNLDEPPETEKTCEKCAYLEGGKKF